jgi:hypothetical protein
VLIELAYSKLLLGGVTAWPFTVNMLLFTISEPYSRPLFKRLIELTLRDENVIWLEGVMPVMTVLRPRTSVVDSEERPVFAIILKKLVD